MSVSYGGDSITFADGSVQSGGWTGMRNRIINGAMVIDQRNAGASFSSPNNYTLDRWAFSNGGGQTYTAQQSSTVPAGAGFVKSIVVTNTNSVAAGTTNYNCLYQSIEGYNIADLNWGTAGAKTVTASFWVRSSVVGTYGFIVRGGASNSYYVSSYSIPVADTWTYVTLTIPGCTTDTWGSTNALGLTVYFDLGVGSTYSASAGFWGTGNVFGLTGGIKFSATNGATFYATGVQLERGSTASSFEYRPFGTELALCQRYLPAYNFSGVNQPSAGGIAYSTTATVMNLIHPVQTRIAPTGITVTGTFNSYNNSGGNAGNFSSITLGQSQGTYSSIINCTGGSGLVQGNATLLLSPSGTSQILLTGCEL